MSPTTPQIVYTPDPVLKNPDGSPVLWPENDPHFEPAQDYYSNKGRYAAIDQQAAQLALQTWDRWAVGAVIANNAGQFATYRQAPVASDGHVVSWNGSVGVIADSGKPVWSPDPTWNVNDWETSETGTGEVLVKINDPARNKQTGGFAGVGTSGSSAAAGIDPNTLAAIIAQAVAAALAAQSKAA